MSMCAGLCGADAALLGLVVLERSAAGAVFKASIKQSSKRVRHPHQSPSLYMSPSTKNSKHNSYSFSQGPANVAVLCSACLETTAPSGMGQ